MIMNRACGAQNPLVTVLMPVYNGEAYLRDAIDSILKQTWEDFELLVIDDGSTDASSAIIRSYHDARIRLVQNPSNLGLVTSLNRGIELARGQYIARMDCDDVSRPSRLAVQVEFMNNNPQVGVCGSWLETIGQIRETWKVPLAHPMILSTMLFESVMYHPTVIIRKKILLEHGLRYDGGFPHAEDYEFWTRCASCCSLANLNRSLLSYRLHPDRVGERHRSQQFDSANRVRQKLLRQLKIKPSQAEWDIHEKLSYWVADMSLESIDEAGAWLKKLQSANRETRVFPEPEFSHSLAARWDYVCRMGTRYGLVTLRRYFNTALHRYSDARMLDRASFLVKCLIRSF